MPSVQPPGVRTARLYVWLVLLSPLLLLGSGIALLGVGLWQHSEGVAAIGAAGIVGAVVLPRLQGAFEFGPGGVKGSQLDDLFRDLIAEGMRRGLPSEETLELAIEGTETASELSPFPVAVLQQALDERRAIIATLVADRQRNDDLAFETRVAGIVERFAASRGWTVQRNVAIPAGVPDSIRRRTHVDFVIDTPRGPAIIEVTILKSPGAIVSRTNQVDLARTALQARAAIVVVPDTGVTGQPTPGVEIVAITDLEAWLDNL